MVLYLVGLGLGDEKDITVRGLEIVKKCAVVYLEHYTSVLGVSAEKLATYYGREVLLADRELVESEAEEKILKIAVDQDVALLVVGDPFGATTHSDLALRAKQRGIQVKVIHNASIMTAIGACGLQLYNYGITISMVFFTDTWKPDSFYPKIEQNSKNGLHTLCLLDIKMKEQSMENMMRGRKIYEPPRFMTVNQCLKQLLEIEEKNQLGLTTKDTLCIGLARMGKEDQFIAFGTIAELITVDFGEPLHSVIIPGKIHPHELEYLETFRVQKKS
eukprot:TRINITY_DN8519_c0_g2_i1.p1 TRINITY_DN8519_c0_g2~~TRINITY_DN8519_c0_g2_i1.p1  ORF type:complete len:274 (-),score=46.87 TRINITY_DN8519_c0_g2_i1:19-840(-)